MKPPSEPSSGSGGGFSHLPRKKLSSIASPSLYDLERQQRRIEKGGTMTDYNTVEEHIDALHDEAEDLADIARHTEDPQEAERLRKKATALVKRAARLREEAAE